MTVRLIQVGLGPWGMDWAAAVIPAVPEVASVAWVEADPAALAAAGTRLGLPAERRFADLGTALAAVEAEAVLATVPLAAHVLVARQALATGRHVLVEKPFAPTLAEAQALVAEAEARGRVLMVAQNYRFYPAVLKVAELVARRALGPVLSADVEFRRYAPADGYRYYGLPDPLLGDMAVHHFDLVRLVLGEEAVEVSCRAWNPPGSGFAHPPAAAAAIQFAGGAVVTYRGSWVSRGPKTTYGGEWRMDCADGQIAWTTRNEAPYRLAREHVVVRPLGGVPEAVPLDPLPRHDRAGVLATFAEAVATGRTPPRFSSGRDNLGTLALVEGAIRSAEARGAPVALADLGRPVEPEHDLG